MRRIEKTKVGCKSVYTVYDAENTVVIRTTNRAIALYYWSSTGRSVDGDEV
jgi:hypothetical protein